LDRLIQAIQPIIQASDNLMIPRCGNPRYEFTIHTYGCKVNTYDTGLLQKRLLAQGNVAVENKTATSSLPRVHVLNTCAVTAEATREAARAVRRIKSREPFSTVVVTGCGAQVDGGVFDELPGADLVIANSHKGMLERLLDEHFKGELKERVFRSNIFRKDDLEAGGGVEAGHTRAFLKIQDGCNSFCTYCVIPFARGKSRSIPVSELVARINELHAQGVNEFVMTGVHIGDYEDERAGRKLLLHDLVSEVLEKTQVPRIRLSSLEPVELTTELLALYKNDRMCPHFHMSIQSANTRVLSLMRRKYDHAAIETALTAIAEQVPGAFIGMDVIVGFPGETDDEFADTYERLARLPWTRIHVFPYSERPGTKAAAFEGSLPREARALRSRRLRELSSQRFAQHARQQIGQRKVVMVLRNGETYGEALSRDYWPVRIYGASALPVGHEIEVTVTSYDESQESRMDGILMAQVGDLS
jgi:threonylcarbamoyladenosine tRNA methylthiotransferase MtaB